MMKVVQIIDKNAILDFLSQDRFYAAYAICDLLPERFRHMAWFMAYEDDQPRALATVFFGSNPNFVFTMGAEEALSEIFITKLSPHRAYLATKEETLSAVKEWYDIDKVENMIRMKIDAPAFHPLDGKAVRLGPEDVSQLNRLYELSGDKSIMPAQLERGIYYGIKKRGKLVSAAGTHLVSTVYKMAAVGNVMTTEGYRNLGYASACTSAVVGEILRMGLDVVLNVSADNPAALRVYKKVGFVEHCSYFEIRVTRKIKILSKAKSILDLLVGEEKHQRRN